MTTVAYSVSVQSSGFSADWIDILIVLGSNEEDAVLTAERWVRNQYPLRQIAEGQSEAYRLSGEARVVGRLINTDEE